MLQQIRYNIVRSSIVGRLTIISIYRLRACATTVYKYNFYLYYTNREVLLRRIERLSIYRLHGAVLQSLRLLKLLFSNAHAYCSIKCTASPVTRPTSAAGMCARLRRCSFASLIHKQSSARPVV